VSSAASELGRGVGIDLGTKRIGIATSDVRGVMASPLLVLSRTGSRQQDHQRLRELVVEEEAAFVVVGVPVALNGKHELAAQAALDEIAELQGRLGVPVHTWDERMSSAIVHKQLAAQNVSSRRRRDQVDKHAAAVILQGWLDANR
jgi:putative holliday junction resolvase